MTELPEPLTPAEADLQGYGFMPLYGHRLFGSGFNTLCNDAEWRAGVTLWWAAWNQVPAGSLPDDDVALARLADLGRDLRRWRRLRVNALRGFVRCADGRLYHKALAPLVVEAWAKRLAERDRKRKYRDRKQGRDADGSKPATGTSASRPPVEGEERDKRGTGDSSSEAVASAGHGEPDALDLPLSLLRAPDGDWSKPLFRQGLAWLARASSLTPAALRPLMGKWLKAAGDDHRRLFELLAAAERQAIADPRGWIAAQLGGTREQATRYRNGFAELIAEGEL
ncbi:MAG TPA: hypothetical protein VN821_10160 [Candidatus Udaeobacter sp.]|nr:hypothetical protein [Candidatus Udaeobacter sp.]